VQQNLTLDVRVSHLDGAIKECIRQLKQARVEKQKMIQDALVEKMNWNLKKLHLRNSYLSSRHKWRLVKLKRLLLLIMISLSSLNV